MCYAFQERCTKDVCQSRAVAAIFFWAQVAIHDFDYCRGFGTLQPWRNGQPAIPNPLLQVILTVLHLANCCCDSADLKRYITSEVHPSLPFALLFAVATAAYQLGAHIARVCLQKLKVEPFSLAMSRTMVATALLLLLLGCVLLMLHWFAVGANRIALFHFSQPTNSFELCGIP